MSGPEASGLQLRFPAQRPPGRARNQLRSLLRWWECKQPPTRQIRGRSAPPNCLVSEATQGVALALVAALLAGIYPARRAARGSPAAVLRND